MLEYNYHGCYACKHLYLITFLGEYIKWLIDDPLILCALELEPTVPCPKFDQFSSCDPKDYTKHEAKQESDEGNPER